MLAVFFMNAVGLHAAHLPNIEAADPQSWLD
jgi:hypothetical protein